MSNQVDPNAIFGLPYEVTYVSVEDYRKYGGDTRGLTKDGYLRKYIGEFVNHDEPMYYFNSDNVNFGHLVIPRFLIIQMTKKK